ncbi:MAG: hypothetical protein JXR48_19280 [Candidatus Delongbacteria bacterium]|nr:hypothetical protein [Candidatus Delongbacteria bacterium]MBN2837105.1 hypothetical protein [Candidatus Delongbacteria bacterium]
MKKTFKIFRYFIYFVFLLISVLLLVLTYTFPSELVKDKLKQFLLENYNVNIELDKIDFSLFDGLELKGFKFCDNDLDSLISFTGIYLKPDIGEIINRRYIIKELKISSPRFNLKTTRDQSNLNKLIERFKSNSSEDKQDKSEIEGNETIFKMAVEAIIIEDACYSQKTDDMLLSVKGVDISANFKLDESVSANAVLSLNDSEFVFRNFANNYNTSLNGKFDLFYGDISKAEIDLKVLLKDKILNGNELPIETVNLILKSEFYDNFSAIKTDLLTLNTELFQLSMDDINFKDMKFSFKKNVLNLTIDNDLINLTNVLIGGVIPEIVIDKPVVFVSKLDETKIDLTTMQFSSKADIELYADEINFPNYDINATNFRLNLGSDLIFSERVDFDNIYLKLDSDKIIYSDIDNLDKLKLELKGNYSTTSKSNAFINLSFSDMYCNNAKIDISTAIDSGYNFDNILKYVKSTGKFDIENINYKNDSISTEIDSDLLIDFNLINEKMHLNLNMNNFNYKDTKLKKNFDNISLKTSVSSDLKKYLLEYCNLSIDSILTVNIMDGIYKNSVVNFPDIDLEINNFDGSDWYDFTDSIYVGKLSLKLDNSGIFEMGKNIVQTDYSMNLKIDNFKYKDIVLSSLTNEGKGYYKSGYFQINDNFSYEGLETRLVPYEELNSGKVIVNFLSDNFKSFNIQKLQTFFADSLISIDLKGGINLIDSVFSINSNISLSGDSLSFLKGIKFCCGNTKINADLKGRFDEIDYSILLNSKYDSLSIGNNFKFYNTDISFPIKGHFDTITEEFSDISKVSDTMGSLTFNSLSLFDKYQIKNLSTNLGLLNSRFTISNLRGDLFGGDITGEIALDIGEKVSDIMNEASCESHIYFTGINPKYFSSDSKGNSRGDVTLRSSLSFKGLDFKNNDLNMRVDLSGLGMKESKQILDFLSRELKDESIDVLRRTLSVFPGVSVTLFSFSISENYINSSVNLDKPWYLFYFPLADRISFSKQSLKFYLDRFVYKE